MALSDDRIAEMMRDTWGCASIAPRHAAAFARAIEAEVRKDDEAELEAIKSDLNDYMAAANAEANLATELLEQRTQDTALILQLVEALEGYRRNHNDTQPCDAERAGRAWLEGKK